MMGLDRYIRMTAAWLAPVAGCAIAAAAWQGAGGPALERLAHAQSDSAAGTEALLDGGIGAGFDPVAMTTSYEPPANCPGIPVGGYPGVTNDRFYFLSEVGGCANLPCFLAEVDGTEHANATLVIDEVCTLTEPIQIPSRFTLAGVGPAGEGMLVFQNLPDYAAAINVAPAVTQGGISEIVIRDLSVFRGAGGIWNSGINVSGGNIVSLQGVRVNGFAVGLFGRDAYSIRVDQSTFYGNEFNVMIHKNANHWSVRDSTLSLAARYSVKIFGPSDGPGDWNNDHVFSGVRFEGSGLGAMQLGSYGAMLMNNRFESNGNHGVTLTSSASGTRVISNLFSTDVVHDLGQGTKCGFNIGLPAGSCPGD